MKDLPFAKYDFWAYLSSGFLLLYALDYLIDSGVFDRSEWTLVQTIVAVSAAYVVGHLIAGMSSMLYERLLVGRLLGSPREALFGKPRARKWMRRVTPGYFQSLPLATRNAALGRSTAAGVKEPGEAMYWLAFNEARNNPAVMARLDTFLNLYGFCRNIALVFFISGAGLLGRFWACSVTPNDLWLGLTAIGISAGMTLRYLKFHRIYAVEVFTAYAHGQPPGPK